MEERDKELLLKDLCARLPYKVIVCDDMKRVYTLTLGTSYLVDLFYSNGDYVDVPIKPYLRPLSSMTEEETVEYCNLQDRFLLSSQYPITDAYALFDWLDKNMFDYRGLIDKNLAIEVTEENNPYKVY